MHIVMDIQGAYGTISHSTLSAGLDKQIIKCSESANVLVIDIKCHLLDLVI